MPSPKQKQLHQQAVRAVRNGEATWLGQLLEQGLDPNGAIEFEHGNPELPLARVGKELYNNGRREMARLLIEHGASTALVREGGVAILDQALMGEHEEFILFLLDHLETLYHPSEPPLFSPRLYEPKLLAAMVAKGMRKDDVEQWIWHASHENTPQAGEVIAWMAENGYDLDAPQPGGTSSGLQSLMEQHYGSISEMQFIRALVDNGARTNHLDLDKIAARDISPDLHLLVDELRAVRLSSTLENTTPSATARRAARRV